MSKYTTEVRYICEHYAGLDESVGYDNVEQVINNCLPKVFDFNFPIFDETYRSVLETKILRHYYTREIGLETVGLWKLKLNTKLNEIMPYYNQLYKSELIEFNPLYDVDLTRERKVEGKGTKDTENTEKRNDSNNVENSQNTEIKNNENVNDNESRNNKTNGTANGTQNQSNTENGTKMYSDTPQGAITDLQAGKYLTNATIDSATITFAGASNDTTEQTVDETVKNERNSEGSSSTSVEGTTDTTFNSNMNGTSNTTLSNTEDYLERVMGSNGGESFSKRIDDYRRTFINIDMMVINELEELFFGLW